jgi:pimeloyl-ACP methyl ester carboxylesterase
LPSAPGLVYKSPVRCTLVWAHDLGSSRAHEDELGLFDWTNVADAAEVVRYDARGHGRTEPTQYYDRAYRWSSMVDDMLRAAGTGPFVAGGAAMGGAVALWTALRAPRRVQALVLAVPPRAWEERGADAARYEEAARLVEARGLPAWAETLRLRPQPRILADELPAAGEVAARHVLTMEEKVVPAVLRGAAASDLPSRDELRTIVVPTLILAWADDADHPLTTAESLAEHLVLSELEVAHDLAAVRGWPRRVRAFLGGLCHWE